MGDVCCVLLGSASFSNDDVNAKDKWRRTALHYAAENDKARASVAIVECARFTEFSHKDMSGHTAMDVAAGAAMGALNAVFQKRSEAEFRSVVLGVTEESLDLA